ncbi:MAG: DNA alkylation repair protein [Dehalococcoidales bacterium]|nr:DNA alkylation repair protein [Dehalococcoidales bacterium]
MVDDIIAAVRRELQAAADPATLQTFKRFFKEDITAYGVKTAVARKIGARFWKDVKSLPKANIYRLCEELFTSDYSEEAGVAIGWARNLVPQYDRSDFRVFERWLDDYVNNWAKCDTLCVDSVGALVVKYPEFLEDLRRWTSSPNLWVRRAAAVSLIKPARKGLLLDVVFDIADRLLTDSDDLVQKGYGWMLKEATHAHQQEVFDYVVKHRSVMPRTALRYAIEKMPPDMRKQAMKRD